MTEEQTHALAGELERLAMLLLNKADRIRSIIIPRPAAPVEIEPAPTLHLTRWERERKNWLP